MSVIDSLLTNAYEDTQLLLKNDHLGDDLSRPRDVDFVLKTVDYEQAKTVSSFITDNQYGRPEIEVVDGYFRIIFKINMPITQNLICSVSALMVCLAALFKLDYDGWGSVLQDDAARLENGE